MFLNSYQHIRSYNALLLKLRYYKTSSKHAVAMPLHKAYFLTWIYRQLRFIAWKWVDRELYGPKKKSYFTRLLAVVSASLWYLLGLLLIYTLLEQGNNSEAYVCTNNNNLKEKRIIKSPVNYTSPFKNAKTIRDL